MTDALNTKKNMILDTARALGIQKWTPAEIDQLRRKLAPDLRGEYVIPPANATPIIVTLLPKGAVGFSPGIAV